MYVCILFWPFGGSSVSVSCVVVGKRSGSAPGCLVVVVCRMTYKNGRQPLIYSSSRSILSKEKKKTMPWRRPCLLNTIACPPPRKRDSEEERQAIATYRPYISFTYSGRYIRRPAVPLEELMTTQKGRRSCCTSTSTVRSMLDGGCES